MIIEDEPTKPYP